MKASQFFRSAPALLLAVTLSAQPSFEGPAPVVTSVPAEDQRLAAYHARVDEVLQWRAGRVDLNDIPGTMDMASISILLTLGRDIEACNERVLQMMAEPGTGPFWMFPAVCVAFTGRELLSPEARASIREAWRTTRQLRGDTENHWVMYYASLYLMSELYPNEPAETWYTGRSSEENLAEAREWLIHWMDTTTTVGQGEFNTTHYIGEYAIPMLFMATWAKDPAMKLRGRMMLDWMFAELATVSLNGVLRGPNARSDEGSVIERWNALASYFSWLLFGNTPPPSGYGGWGLYFAPVAKNYVLPEVIHRIAVERDGDYVQRDRARTRRFWRYSDVLSPPVYKTNYLRHDYAVGSTQGIVNDVIQAHVWDVTWREEDPRGKHPTMFSLHPHSSGRMMQAQFATYPEPMPVGVTFEGKPSYDSPDKVLGGSPYEKVFQDLDTVIALYDIAPGERFEHINGFFSKDLRDVTEDASGWIFARGGNAFLAYRPLAPYHWIPYLHYNGGWATVRDDLGGRVLTSPHLKNGTIVQAAGADEFESFEAFKAAMRALPLEFTLEPVPSVRFTTLRGKNVAFTYGEAPVVDGVPVDYSKWKLFEGPYLNAEVGGRKLTVTHGRLQRVLDFNTLTVKDSVRE
ncbi:MAG TPA: hypothetical protein PKY38_08545 [Opitutaceae bacterium]|nr:hypothetical protein [Opitutaceae bacterium]